MTQSAPCRQRAGLAYQVRALEFQVTQASGFEVCEQGVSGLEQSFGVSSFEREVGV